MSITVSVIGDAHQKRLNGYANRRTGKSVIEYSGSEYNFLEMEKMYTNEFYKIMDAAKERGMKQELLEDAWEMLEADGWNHKTIVNIMWKKIQLKQY